MSDQTDGGQSRPGYESTQAMPAAAPPPVPPPAGGPADGDKGGDGRRWKTWQMLVVALVALLVGVGIGSSGADEDDAESDLAVEDTSTTTEEETATTEEATTTTEPPTTTEAPTTTTTSTTEPPPPPPAEDVEVVSYSGSGTQSMRPFDVPDGWEIQWDFTGDILQIYLNDESGEFTAIPANQQGSGSGSSYQARGGT